jgi:methionyl-tRNA synthetase
MKSKFISTPIFYANAEPHLGHAYASVLTDCLHRYDVIFDNPSGKNFFVTGMDEHGQKIYEKAKSENKTPKELVDDIAKIFINLDEKLNVKYDRFIRTTDKDHKIAVQKLWTKLVSSGDLYKKEYEGLYCVGCEGFKTVKDLNEEGLCPDHLKAPIILKENNWFFKLSKYQDFLKDKIENDIVKIIPESRKKEILSFMSEGLQDISFSRSKEVMSWGIDVPGDDTQVMYVWCDALTNYITAAGYGDESADFDINWTNAETTHIIGKDILRFHALYWPAMLESVGLSLPKNILVHGLIKSGGVKMSKSLGNGITPDEILSEYIKVNQVINPDTNLIENKSILEEAFQSEVFRYFFLKNISPFDDGDYTLGRMKELYNADLSNGIGNLVSRTMRLSEKYLETRIDFPQIDMKVNHSEYVDAFDNFDVKSAFDYVFKLVKSADLYMQENEPFKVIKVDELRGKEMLENLRVQIYTIARLLNPFIPETSKIIKEIVKQNKMPIKSLFPKYE